MAALAPAEPVRSDREAYEFVGKTPLAPACRWTIYCYRPLVPVVVHRLPFDLDTNWRVVQIAGTAAAGTVLAVAAAPLSTTALLPVMVSAMAQTSYGFAFTAYDPYSPDPFVFLVAALLLWCWTQDRWRLAIALAAAGVFVKETVGAIAGAFAIAALIERPPSPFGLRRIRWLLPAAGSAITLAVFHLTTQLWLQWDITQNPAAQWRHGFWLGLWWRTNPFLERKIYMLFATFGFAWVFAALGWRLSPQRWRALAPALILPMAMLSVIQTPERALANAFFIVAPLAAVYVSREPAVGAAAIALNAVMTAKAGTSSAWLPSGRWIGIAAAIAAIALVTRTRRETFGANDESFRRGADEAKRITRN